MHVPHLAVCGSLSRQSRNTLYLPGMSKLKHFPGQEIFPNKVSRDCTCLYTSHIKFFLYTFVGNSSEFLKSIKKFQRIFLAQGLHLSMGSIQSYRSVVMSVCVSESGCWLIGGAVLQSVPQCMYAPIQICMCGRRKHNIYTETLCRGFIGSES